MNPLGPIQNAADQSLNANPGTLPDVSGALLSWFQLLSFTTITDDVYDGKNHPLETTVEFYGVRQPFTSQQLSMKPEGERAWKWEMIHALPTLILSPNDTIVFGGVQYKVMGKYDYKEYGYVQYEIVQRYQ